MNPVVKANLIFTALMLLGAIVLAQMGWYVAHQMWGVPLAWNVLQYCVSGAQDTIVGRDVIVYILNLAVIYTLARIAWRTAKQLILTSKWMRAFRNDTHHGHTSRLNAEFREWKTEIIVVKDAGFVALSIGMLRPRIVISTGLLAMFTEEEVRAILLHERYHCQRRDPLQAFMTALTKDSMGYIPLVRTLAHHYATWQELLADRYAMKQMGTEYYLGSVLMKLSSLARVRRDAATVPFASNEINYRILQVLQPDQTIHVPFSFGKPLMFTIALLCVVTGFTAGSCS
ncbi:MULTISPECIES: M56 family metallopeptidase [unclassified Paenibacillus]|uniref:M56 family metallopeptidase n=1 Tax=unclassified Paenibacillus TaxID=185978 RepID=UPI001C0FE9B8|nr:MULTISPECIES: M56 family metallopeptidase [unclassified Paenibacillus]MBU5442922.1 M56 family metallopeptidase [Paenibacillus sp. MSJ-34]CAH0119531.1 hypothetical protein PAE9249_02035 [Paenibacillus sp. CECT 9249]